MKKITPNIKKETISRVHKVALLFISMSVLVLEFTLIRVLSVSLWYHFAFMIISIALLGLGISGVTIIISDRINKSNTDTFLSITSLLFAISIIVSFLIINKIPFDPFNLFVDSNQFIYLPLYYITITLPFFLAGLIIGKLFTSFNDKISSLYFFDRRSRFKLVLFLYWFFRNLEAQGIIFASGLAAYFISNFSLKKNKFATITLFSAS
jgi:hypothetical protein